MSCLGPNYNPVPPREWARYNTPCTSGTISISPFEAYNLAVLAKGNILQYKNNSANITKQQRYAQIARGKWTNRTTTWASQTQTTTNPNVKSLKRNGYTGSADGINTKFDPRICPPPVPIVIYGGLPAIGTGGGTTTPIIPPIPVNPPGPIPILPPLQDVPVVPELIIPDGGTLQCNIVEDICTGQVYNTFSTQNCYPTSASDVPGPIIYLCYNSNGLPTYYPKTKRIFGNSTDSWPVNAKFIRPA